ncbi:MAG: hypothetical protein K9J16_12625 [Melioribacteraceae bacterium]|nr:hypothetical protein [Melioribacteraceae bacterium]MCF8356010.1 hypothetical protein [Melioribacteraceae bacterium]MCF8394679.1 hypothetical protein [Melioribacteraceae bacterium]MCF8420243.1 hypothetical protein [Melioribacteraceae bacterium]
MIRRVSYILVFAAAILFIILSLEINFVQDDTFIFLRYADNFLNGNGFVFNSGEMVEGYSSISWLMLLTIILALKIDPVTGSQMLSMFFGILVLAAVLKLSESIKVSEDQNPSRSLFYNILPVILLALTGGFHYWSISGMETSLFMLLFLITVKLYIKNQRNNKPDFLLALVLYLLSVTRPEGLLLYALLVIFTIIFDREKVFSKGFLFTNVLFIMPMILTIFVRYYYYDNLLPNTLYAKSGVGEHYLTRGITYFYQSFKYNLLFGLILAPAFIFIKKIVRQKELLLLLFTAFGYTFIITLFGGDVLPHHRYYLPVLPLFFILFSKSLNYIFNSSKVLGRVAVVIIIIVIIPLSIVSYKSELPLIIKNKRHELGLVKKMSIYAQFIKEESEKSKKRVAAALSTIGAFSYYSSAEVIDFIGLTDKYIANNPKEIEGIDDSLPIAWRERKYNIDYVLSREPDFIIFPAGAKPSAYAEAAIFSRKEFIKYYYPQLIYSRELNVNLPIFTRREIPLSTGSVPDVCRTEFVKYYIVANNLFLKYLETKNSLLLQEIEMTANKMIELCTVYNSYAYSIIGYSNFHAGNMETAKENLKKSVELDPLNCISLFYLSKVYLNLNDLKSYLSTTYLLNKYSPAALPNLISAGR